MVDHKLKIRLLWAVLFSTGFMAFLLMKVDFKHFSFIISRLDIKYLIAAYGVFILGNLVRTFRFHQLDHIDRKMTHWWYVNAFYNFITATLPGGSGEAATAYLLKRFSMFNILGAFRILFLARLMDLFALSALFFISAIWMSNVTPYRNVAIWLSVALFFISLVALLPSSEQFVLKIIQRLPGRSKLIQRVCEKLSELLEISKKQRSVSSLAFTLIQSVLMMIGGGIALHLLLQSFGIDFTTIQSFFCYGVYAIFQIVPIQGIAGIGTQAAWMALALNAAGYKGQDTIAMGFVVHGTFYIFIAVLGLGSMFLWLKGKKVVSLTTDN